MFLGKREMSLCGLYVSSGFFLGTPWCQFCPVPSLMLNNELWAEASKICISCFSLCFCALGWIVLDGVLTVPVYLWIWDSVTNNKESTITMINSSFLWKSWYCFPDCNQLGFWQSLKTSGPLGTVTAYFDTPNLSQLFLLFNLCVHVCVCPCSGLYMLQLCRSSHHLQRVLPGHLQDRLDPHRVPDQRCQRLLSDSQCSADSLCQQLHKVLPHTQPCGQ